MDPRLLMTTFVSIFLAELGDKTQLATFGMAASAPSVAQKLTVFCGASLALILASALGVLFGELVGRLVDPRWIKGGAGLIFVVLGAFYLKDALMPSAIQVP